MARLINSILLALVVLALAAGPAAAMPAVVISSAVGAALSVGVGVAVGTIATFSWAAFATAFATSMAFSVLGGLLSRKPEAPTVSDFASQARGRQVVIRSATEPRRIIYGEVSASGPLTFASVTGANNEFLHLVVPLAGHEVDSIPRVFLGDDEVGTLDAQGNCISGKFSGYVRIKKYLGTDAQTADTDLVAECPDLWTTAHRGRGVAYLYLRLRFQQDIFPNGIPNVRAIVRGKKCYDPRDGGTRYTRNWALQVRDWLAADYGLDCDSDELDDTSHIAAANICDERVLVDGGSPRYSVTFSVDTATDIITFLDPERRFDTGDGVAAFSTGTLPSTLAGSPNQFYFIRLSDTTGQLASTYANAIAGTAIVLGTIGSGTHSLQHVDQARYTGNGVVSLADTPESIIREMMTAAMGAVVYQQGVYKIYAGAYRTPVMDLDEDNLAGGLLVKPRIARSELYNGVRGTFVDPTRNWQATDFPPVTNSTYETQDGGQQILRDVQFPFTTNNIRAQRMAKIILERSRQSITVQAPCNLSVLKLAPFDTVRLSISLLGWTDKVFMVLGWEFNEAGGINLQLQEEASAVYDWSFGDATLVDPAPDSNLPGVDTIRRAVPLRVSGLQLFGDDASATEFTGRDCKFVWRRGALFGGYELGSEQFGAGDGADDFFFKDYEVKVYNTSGTLLRTEYVIDNLYTYTYEKNFEDTAGVPVREFSIEVRQRTRYNQVSALPAVLQVSNPAPVIAGFTTTAKRGGFDFSFTQPTDPDYGGIRIYADPTTGFTANASTLVYQGSKVAGSAPVAFPGMTYKLKYVPYDVFGDGSTSAELDVETSTALPTNELASLGKLGILSTALATSGTSLFGFAPSNIGTPVFAPVTGNLVLAARHPSTGDLWLASVSPEDHSVAKIVNTGLSASVFVADYKPVYCPATASVFMSNQDGGGLYSIIEVDPVTLSVSWSETVERQILCYSPVDGLLLAKDGSSLRTLTPGTHTWSSAVTPGGSFSAYAACYVPSADKYFVSSTDKKVYSFTRALASGSSLAIGGSPQPLGNSGILYCPIDDRAWVLAYDSASYAYFQVITPNLVSDAIVTASKFPDTAIYCSVNGAVIAVVQTTGYQLMTYNPIQQAEMIAGLIDTTYYPVGGLGFSPQDESLHGGASRVSDGVRYLLKFSL
jgi:hypothetical protein